MAVKLETFLSLDESIGQRLFNSFRREYARVLADADALLKRGRYERALDIIDSIDLHGIAERNLPYFELVGMQAAMFGVSQLRPPKESAVARAGKPDAIERGANVMAMMIYRDSAEQIKRRAGQFIERYEALRREQLVETQKASLPINTDASLASFVDDEGRASFNVAGSLYNSRMAQWGFLTEAQVLGVTAFEVSEQLDNRTCPTCQIMHGKQFPVDTAKQKIDMWLSVEDPSDLASLAPWPGQSQADIAQLSQMSTADLIRAGWDTPPYHPRCRGVLIEIEGTITIDVEVLPRGRPEDFNEPLKDFISLKDMADWKYLRAVEEDKIVSPFIRELADLVGGEFPPAFPPGVEPDGTGGVELGSFLYYRIKGKGSMQRKIKKYMDDKGLTLEQAAERLPDSLRYTYIFDEASYSRGVKDTLDALAAKGYRRIDADNSWFERPDYRGINAEITSPNGVKFELQFHTPTSFEIKQNVNHVLYEQWRVLKKRDPQRAVLYQQMIDNASTIPMPSDTGLLRQLGDSLYNGRN